MGTFIGNTTATQYLFRRITSQFESMYRRGAFLQWYINEGMDRMEFSSAFANVEDVIADYDQYQNATGHQEVIDHENHPYKLSPPEPIHDEEDKVEVRDEVHNEEESNPERSNAEERHEADQEISSPIFEN